jgi:hypothetical protein
MPLKMIRHTKEIRSSADRWIHPNDSAPRLTNTVCEGFENLFLWLDLQVLRLTGSENRIGANPRAVSIL